MAICTKWGYSVQHSNTDMLLEPRTKKSYMYSQLITAYTIMTLYCLHEITWQMYIHIQLAANKNKVPRNPTG